MDYVLQANALCKNYGRFRAIDRLCMSVPKGSVYGLVGKNGAGKTTLIRTVCGLQIPSSGEYSLYGKKYTEKEIRFSRRRMGAVVESPAIYLNMTAEENLRQQYRVLGLPSDSGIADLLTLVGLDHTGTKTAGRFSLGMRQRLGIAVALAGNPDFLVLDEPANGLDPQGIVEIRELILRLNREREITVLISSHILDELSRLATHYGFMDGGRVIREISAEALDSACKKCLRAEVSDVKKLARVLDRLQVEYKILSDMKADIFSQMKISDLAAALAADGCELLTVREHDEDLESYYLNLIGGKENV